MGIPKGDSKQGEEEEKLNKGDVVLIPFPFSDLSSSKIRPALVVASLMGDDVILCQITSKSRFDEHSVSLDEIDFRYGYLEQQSWARPNRLFTADNAIILKKIGRLKAEKMAEITEALVSILYV